MWYSSCVATPVQSGIWFKSSEVLRWRMRGLLKALPARASGSPSKSKEDAVSPAVEGERFRIAYLFAGTYGDFVQVLRPLNRLAAAYPKAAILLLGGDRYAREFASELPASVEIARPTDPLQWISHPVDLLFTNCVGVYRVRFEFAARFCARRAFGFRHAHETQRGGYAATIPLMPHVRSFAEENLKLLDLAGVPLEDWTARILKNVHQRAGNSESVASTHAQGWSGGAEDLPPWGKGKILFHIGSAGLKKDFGLETYARLVVAVLGSLERRPVEVVMGPGDEDIAQEVRARTGFIPQVYPLPRLIQLLRAFEGTVLCFNSFPAHICHYLGHSAIVMHREAVPYGYDCAPMHRQVVLQSKTDWDLGGVWDALQEFEAGT